MVVYSSDESSTNAYNEFKIAASAKNICIVFESRLDTPLQESQLEDAASGILMNQNARFVLTLLPESAFQELYSRILGKTNNVFNLTFVFPPFTEKASNIVLKSSVHALGAVQLRHAPGPRFEDFRQFYRNLDEKAFPTVPLFAEFWQQRFQCNLQGQNGNNALRYRKFCNNLTLSLRNDDITSRIGYVITAVDALLMSIKEICPRGDICQSLNQTMFDQAIPKIVKRGEKVFDAKTGGPTSFQFDIFNLQKMEKEDQYVQVGTVKQDAQISYLKGFSIMAYQRHRGSGNDEVVQTKPTSLCNPRSCEACRAPPPVVTTVPPPNTTVTDDMERILGSYGPLRTHRIAKNAYVTGIFFRQFREDRQYTSRLYASDYRSIWSIALAVLAGLGIIAVILLEISLIYLILTYKFEGPEGKRRSHLNLRSLWLGQLLLFGIFLSYLTLFAYLPVPTKASCGITRFGIGISYAIIFSCLLVKLMVILHTRNTANYIPGEVNSSFQHSIGYMVSIFLIAFSVQLIIAIHWLIQVPPEAVLVRDNAGDLVWICNHYTWSLQHGFWEMPMFFRTEFENHILSLIYIMFLILLTFFFALKAFHIVVNMRESRFIALATGISILIFIAWGLIGGLLRNHEKSHEIGDGCIGFGLFFTSTVILFALFLPKVRQLVVIGMEGVFLEDDKETTYASSIYSPASVISPSGHRSMSGYAEGSVIGMHPMDRSVHVVSDAHNFSSDDMSRPIITVDTSFMSPDPPFIYDPHALQLKHPRSSGPSLYSVRSTPNLYDPPDVYSTRGTKLTRNFTGRSYMNETFSGSEYPSLYRPKSETHLYKHPRSEIGSL
ncbi:metabotropic glutamate receptor 2-like [Liolophura sinensis]|uniref:metabotropic glutamate receptor 2-like n=1 Tax=Liolophura sinensis TaxID=3198878 RepID=UPI0031595557